MTGPALKDNPLNPSVADDVTMVVGAEDEVGETTTVTCTFLKFGKAIAEKGAFKAYLSSDAAGLVPSSAPSGGTAIGGSAGSLGALIEDIADVSFTLICNAAGIASVIVTDSGASPIYLNVVTPDGRIHTATMPFGL